MIIRVVYNQVLKVIGILYKVFQLHKFQISLVKTSIQAKYNIFLILLPEFEVTIF